MSRRTTIRSAARVATITAAALVPAVGCSDGDSADAEVADPHVATSIGVTSTTVSPAAAVTIAAPETPDTTAPTTTTPTTTTPTTTTPTTTTPTTTAPTTTAPAVTTDPLTTIPPGERLEGPTTLSASRDFRDYTLVVPSGHDGSPLPLVMMLHGYTASGSIQEMYFQLGPLADERRFLFVYPDGTYDPVGNRFWNATDACCDFAGSGVDDVGHLLGIIDDVSELYPVDPDRIHLVGHSNGGFMSYRMACEHADVFASVVSLAGAMLSDPDECRPSKPVSVVQVHGTLDDVIRFEGGSTPGGGAYPGALGTVEAWASSNGCDGGTVVSDAILDLDASIDGPDTDVTSFEGCPDGISVELWTIDGGRHVPPLTDEFRSSVVDALLERPRPSGGG